MSNECSSSDVGLSSGGSSDVVFKGFSQLMSQYIQNVVTDMAVIISDEKKVPKDEIIHMWNSVCPEYEIGVKTKPKKTLDKVCEWTGNKNGKCNIKVSVNSSTGKYCFRHIKHENQPEGVHEESSDDEKKTVDKNEQQAQTQVQKKEFRIKFNRKARLYLDEEYNYVFDRISKGAYGKYVDGEIKPLDENDIQFIKSNGGILKE